MLFLKRTYKVIILGLLLLNPAISFALEDGFGSAKRIEGQRFAIYCAPQLEASNLAKRLNLDLSDSLMVGKSAQKDFSSETGLTDMVDTLFMRVCDILDMQLYSYRGNIKVCQDTAQMNEVYNNLFGKDLNRQSFYVYDLNTIYIAAENFKPEILGHEIAHAVISHYFVVLPSIKIQEVLAMYVEYQLRRTNGQ